MVNSPLIRPYFLGGVAYSAYDTPENLTDGYPKRWFGKGDSFLNMAIFGIYMVSILNFWGVDECILCIYII